MTTRFVSAVKPILPASEEAHFFVCSSAGVLVREAEPGQPSEAPRLPTRAELAALPLSLQDAHYLGRLDETDCWASFYDPASRGDAAQNALPAGFMMQNLRKLYGRLPEALFAVAGRAFQIAHWEDTNRFCGRCGSALLRQADERAKKCPMESCGLQFFPRLSPAVIVLVRRGEQALLARSSRFPFKMYSTLAGFVEAGEQLEETVVREIREEVGIEIERITYFGSQSWPFPNSLMLAFTAWYKSGELVPDGNEILDAQFFSADALPPIPPRLSIARQLIDAWLDDVGHKSARVV